MPVGNRVFLKRKMPDREVMKQFEQIPAANAADTMNRICALNPRIRLMSSPKRSVFVGPALTVKARAGDNLMIHKALNIAEEGDVIIVSNEGDQTRALMGELMFRYAFDTKKIAAIILDGPIRDVDAAMVMDAHIYATGTTPGGPYKEGPGEVNVPISCGEISVNPGDIVLGDSDGVIIIPRADAEAVLEASKALKENDLRKLKATINNDVDRSWIETKLKEKNTEIIDGCYNAERQSD